ncbi:hypothetical protein niasHT_026483 [Heterodera trifolii]|uniref:Uncharacterized protein n=1 Tax=Heterodera trifolii TaxID=157864 RepID=A0ABD2JSS8_9BILA
MYKALTEVQETYEVIKRENAPFLLGICENIPNFNRLFQKIENAFTYLNEENLASATPPAPNSAETSASVHSEPTYEQPPSVLPKDGTNAQQQLNLSDRSSVSPLKVAVDTSGSVVPSRTVHPTEDVEQRKRDVPTRPTAQPPKPPTNAERSTSQSVGGGLSIDNSGTESRIRKPTELVWQGSHIPSPPKSKPPPPPAQSAKQGQGTSFGLVGSSPNRLPLGQNVCETAGTSSLKVEEHHYAEISEPDEQNSAKKKTTSIPIPKTVTRRNPRKDTGKK